jgi:epoxyqueuosine reductase
MGPIGRMGRMVTSLSEVWPALAEEAHRAGVARIGASALEDEHREVFAQWIEARRHASMAYLERTMATRLDPASRFGWARSVVSIAVPYMSERPPAPPEALSNHVARYALGDDYHEVLDGILRRLEATIHERDSAVVTWRYVDTGPLSDRALGAQAGLGWIGRNGMLIDPEQGSYFFIGTLLTSLGNDMAVEEVSDRCGTCTRCVDACPTEAILPDRTIESARCISYGTIEHRGELPAAIVNRLEGNAFGCDICQEVCPWNHAPAEPHPSFLPREIYRATPITDLLRFEQEDFSTLFRKSAVKRARLGGMLRNVRAVISGRGESPGVERLHPLPIE